MNTMIMGFLMLVSLDSLAGCIVLTDFSANELSAQRDEYIANILTEALDLEDTTFTENTNDQSDYELFQEKNTESFVVGSNARGENIYNYKTTRSYQIYKNKEQIMETSPVTKWGPHLKNLSRALRSIGCK